MDNHRHSVALHYMFYNFCRIHQTLKVTPAMEAGITDHIWSLEEICALLPKPVVKHSKIEQDIILAALDKHAHAAHLSPDDRINACLIRGYPCIHTGNDCFVVVGDGGNTDGHSPVASWKPGDMSLKE